MEAIRIIKTITSDILPELNNFKGESVEIIILPNIKPIKKSITQFNNLKGSCSNLPDGIKFQQKMRTEWER